MIVSLDTCAHGVTDLGGDYFRRWGSARGTPVSVSEILCLSRGASEPPERGEQKTRMLLMFRSEATPIPVGRRDVLNPRGGPDLDGDGRVEVSEELVNALM